MNIPQRKFALVYQSGIANVFEVECLNLKDFGREAKRLVQADFKTAESFARGLATGGHIVASFHCNMAGEIKNFDWSDDMDNALWREQMSPVEQRKCEI
jgi:hypothetical protein